MREAELMHFTASLFEFLLFYKTKKDCMLVQHTEISSLSVLWQKNPTMKEIHLPQFHVQAGVLPFVVGKVSETKNSR